MKRIIILCALPILLISCGGECKMKGQLESVSAELESTKAELAALKSEADEKLLVHNVFFQTKPELSEAEMADLMAKLESLEQVESTEKVWVGKPAATGDPRLVSDYQVALQVTFSSQKKLAEYQQDAHHLKMREEASKHFAAPPVVYDFWVSNRHL